MTTPGRRMGAESRLGRVVVRISATRTFLRLVAPVVPALDRLMHRVTHGRRMFSEGGVVPILLLETTGARSGSPRSTPLAYIRDGEAIYVVGSNYGRERHPGWTENLLHTPSASAWIDGKQCSVRAELLGPVQKEAVWPKLVAAWPNYDVYAQRSGRDLRVFQLSERP